MAKDKNQECCSCCTTAVKVIVFTVIGIILVITGGVLIPVFNDMINKTIKNHVKLKNGSQAYDEWHQPTSPIYMSFYLFDLNNHDEVMKGGKPNVTQKGPYVYRETRRNDPVQWSDNGNELTYLQYKWYYFAPELSCFSCTPDDEILTINVPVMTLANATKFIPGSTGGFSRWGLQQFMNYMKATLFHKLKVKEIIWGYNDTLLIALKQNADDPSFQSLAKLLNMSIADINPFVQLQYNGTNEANMIGELSIYTGLDNASKVQDTYSWKGQRIMSNWNNPNGTTYGNMVNGSDGTHFKPFLDNEDVIYVFIPDVCRSLYLNYESKLTFKDIDLRRFTTIPDLFMNGVINKANLPFCVPRCFRSGLLPVGQCLPLNPPVVMSAPHFYQGDPSLVDDIIGLHPEKEKHATFIDVEPLTGITMKVYKRLQANLLVEQVANITLTNYVRSMAYPILFIEESAIIDDADAAKFRKQVYKPITITKVTQYGLIGIGALFFMLALFLGINGFRLRTASDKEYVDEQSRSLIDGNQVL